MEVPKISGRVRLKLGHLLARWRRRNHPEERRRGLPSSSEREARRRDCPQPGRQGRLRQASRRDQADARDWLSCPTKGECRDENWFQQSVLGRARLQEPALSEVEGCRSETGRMRTLAPEGLVFRAEGH